MKPSKLILHFIILAMALSPFFPALSQAASQEELFEKIKALEMQIQELKKMKAQQNQTEEKAQHCIKAVGTEKFCKCLAEELPGDISFEQYVHSMVALPDDLSDSARKRNGKGSVEVLSVARDKCIAKVQP
ncbi:MAG: hypothetical protein V2B20_16175 [Pseudomonadota bacterium]